MGPKIGIFLQWGALFQWSDESQIFAAYISYTYHQLLVKKFFAAQKLDNCQLSSSRVSSLLE